MEGAVRGFPDRGLGVGTAELPCRAHEACWADVETFVTDPSVTEVGDGWRWMHFRRGVADSTRCY
jgi:hypothetical protein